MDRYPIIQCFSLCRSYPVILGIYLSAVIDLLLIFRRKIATYTSLQSPKISIPILDDASSAMSSIVPSSLSISSSVRQPSSLSSSSVSSSRRTVQAHSSPLLLRLDKNKKAEVPLRCRQLKMDVLRDFQHIISVYGMHVIYLICII